VSEKSTRKAPDYAFKSRAARNRSVFRPQLQLYRCHTAEERYNPSKSGLKKEIPVQMQHWSCNSHQGRYNFSDSTPKQEIQVVYCIIFLSERSMGNLHSLPPVENVTRQFSRSRHSETSMKTEEEVTMKHWVASAFLITCVMLISCKGTSTPFQKSPGDIVKAYYAAANEGRYSDVRALFSEGGKKLLDSDLAQLAGGIKGICDKDTKNGTVTKVEIVSQSIRGEGATVIANVFYKDGSTKSNDTSPLILENGSWKLTGGD